MKLMSGYYPFYGLARESVAVPGWSYNPKEARVLVGVCAELGPRRTRLRKRAQGGSALPRRDEGIAEGLAGGVCHCEVSCTHNARHCVIPTPCDSAFTQSRVARPRRPRRTATKWAA